jgi:hypothetical protein
MKITIIKGSSSRKPTGYCTEMVDEPPFGKKS